MAGGLSTRMGPGIKPLLNFNGRHMIEWVLEAATGCKAVERANVTVTPQTLQIKSAIEAEFIETEARGFVDDMVFAIKHLGLKKTMVLSADLPLLTAEDLGWVASEYNRLGTPALAVFVPSELYRKLGLQPSIELNDLVPAGVNIVDGENLDGKESQLITSNPRFAFNINTPNDLEKALEFAGEGRGE